MALESVGVGNGSSEDRPEDGNPRYVIPGKATNAELGAKDVLAIEKKKAWFGWVKPKSDEEVLAEIAREEGDRLARIAATEKARRKLTGEDR